ncbi:MAG: class I SAM-dependent methyltransferase [Actinomycetota bacterium]
MEERSVSYDRIAERYDATRGYTDAGTTRITELLTAEFAGRGNVLEIGVGTGQVALSLHAAGVPVFGVDRSQPMLSRVGEKAGGAPPFPVVIGDATEMPFSNRIFGAAYFRWVLHLIRDWRAVMAEAVRVVVPAGVIAGDIGGMQGTKYEVQRHFEELAGVVSKPIGLPWSGWTLLDTHMESLGCLVRLLPGFDEPDRQSMEEFIQAIQDNIYSWTWKLDPETRVRHAQATRTWAQKRFGDLDALHQVSTVGWHVYEVGDR